MGRQRRHGQRPVALQVRTEAVEVRGGPAEAAGIPAHLVEREQPSVAVERGVLHPLGHDRAADLLERDDDVGGAVQDEPADRRNFAGSRWHGRRAARAGRLDHPPGRLRDRLARAHVRPVHLEFREEGHQGFPDAPPGQVPGGRLRPGGRGEPFGEPVHLRGQHMRDDVAFGCRLDHAVVTGVPGEVLVELGEGRFRAGVDEQTGDLVERVVSGRARALPCGRQLLGALEDLLGDDPCTAGVGRDALQVGLRVGEAVGMVDSQAVHVAGPDVADQHRVGLLVDVAVFDPQSGEGGDVEEPPVVEFLAAYPPVA